jgi:hypothetical protein
VVAIGEDRATARTAPTASEPAIHVARKADAEALHRLAQVAPVIRLDDQVHVVVLDRDVTDARALEAVGHADRSLRQLIPRRCKRGRPSTRRMVTCNGRCADCDGRRPCSTPAFPLFGFRPACARRPPQPVPFFDGRFGTAFSSSCPADARLRPSILIPQISPTPDITVG